ncbi:multiple sugar transport system permease protein [Devosia crocina]|uniref:Multiple sugar transport system permease protein n=1 Tax=Devosia crocina TaxID=429728 RepID=A0A1I7N2B9_9HYPH|nr:carbohydrate ABC transporter permease [Devosia crocina]SFV28807.1 multiple sugar transport system permease protein [Devosia crocina]
MSALDTAPAASVATADQGHKRRSFDIGGAILTLVTVIFAVLWAFPIYWGVITSLKPESQVISRTVEFLPRTWTIDAYWHVLVNTMIGRWYINSLVTSVSVTVLTLIISATTAYALSQLRFPGRTVIWYLILASFMVPIAALIVNHFILMAQFGLINNWLGVILPQLIHPVVIIVYKNFFDSVPKEYREAAKMDSASEWRIFSRIYVPMNWGVTTALAIVTFIGAWNNFLWPFLAVSRTEMMNVAVGITQVNDAFGVQYARELAAAILAALVVAILYLIFQRRVTQAIMLSAGVKG